MTEVSVDQEDMYALVERLEALSEEVAALREQMAVPEAEPHIAQSLGMQDQQWSCGNPERNWSGAVRPSDAAACSSTSGRRQP